MFVMSLLVIGLVLPGLSTTPSPLDHGVLTSFVSAAFLRILPNPNIKLYGIAGFSEKEREALFEWFRLPMNEFTANMGNATQEGHARAIAYAESGATPIPKNAGFLGAVIETRLSHYWKMYQDFDDFNKRYFCPRFECFEKFVTLAVKKFINPSAVLPLCKCGLPFMYWPFFARTEELRENENFDRCAKAVIHRVHRKTIDEDPELSEPLKARIVALGSFSDHVEFYWAEYEKMWKIFAPPEPGEATPCHLL
jgi:hypothetical protein